MKTLRGLSFLVLAGCHGATPPMTTMAPKSDFAEWTHTLYLQVIGWDSLILAIVALATFVALFRYSTRAREGEAPTVSREHLALEVTWTVGPALVLVAIAIPTIRTTFRSQPAEAPPEALEVKVTAHQWWWQVQYLDLEITTANEIHLPAGRPVRLSLESADVIHSFWVPQLGGKRDIIPGHTNAITLVPRVPGVYLGQCAEFCGLSHANMRFRVFVDTPAQFTAWSAQQTAPAAVPGRPAEAATLVEAGAQLYAASPCVTCHTVNGVSTQRVGPDLTHFGSRTTLAGGTLDNTPENLAAWLRNPPAVKPGAQMPDLGLTAPQIAQLAAYLESLK
ncbi:MAG: cytochrome c oxidase subunit II [Candidatus Binatia bacterium]